MDIYSYKRIFFIFVAYKIKLQQVRHTCQVRRTSHFTQYRRLGTSDCMKAGWTGLSILRFLGLLSIRVPGERTFQSVFHEFSHSLTVIPQSGIDLPYISLDFITIKSYFDIKYIEIRQQRIFIVILRMQKCPLKLSASPYLFP